VILSGKERVGVDELVVSLVLPIGSGNASDSGGCWVAFFEVEFLGLVFGVLIML
jgi:hypothetical protein